MRKHPTTPEYFFREPGDVVELNACGAAQTYGYFLPDEKVRFLRYTEAGGTPVVQELESSDPDCTWYITHHGIKGGA